jgi:hypothetical protein
LKPQGLAMPIPVEMPRTIAQIDLLPGNAAIDSAALSLRSPDGTARARHVGAASASHRLLSSLRFASNQAPQIVTRMHYRKPGSSKAKR